MNEIGVAIEILTAWSKAHPPIPIKKGECFVFMVGKNRRCGKPGKFQINDNPEDADYMWCAEHHAEHMIWLNK